LDKNFLGVVALVISVGPLAACSGAKGDESADNVGGKDDGIADSSPSSKDGGSNQGTTDSAVDGEAAGLDAANQDSANGDSEAGGSCDGTYLVTCPPTTLCPGYPASLLGTWDIVVNNGAYIIDNDTYGGVAQAGRGGSGTLDDAGGCTISTPAGPSPPCGDAPAWTETLSQKSTFTAPAAFSSGDTCICLGELDCTITKQ
jgi:hypothetical protein